MIKTYHIICPNCGFEYDFYCDEQDFEEMKEELLRCPCGAEAEIQER